MKVFHNRSSSACNCAGIYGSSIFITNVIFFPLFFAKNLSYHHVNMKINRLNLLAPLFYFPEAAPDPFSYREGDGDKLYCFEIDETQRLSFEPDAKTLLKKLVSGGNAAGAAGGARLELPSGDYLFAQERELLGREEIIAAAVEIQAEGLWQRLEPGNRLYLRYLFEDGRAVTQLFRPYLRKS